MEMTNNEIASKFKKAKDKIELISVLAQLNGCSKEKIKQSLNEWEEDRLNRIQVIPEVVRKFIQKEIEKLVDEMMELEKQHDILVDYLNGECEP